MFIKQINYINHEYEVISLKQDAYWWKNKELEEHQLRLNFNFTKIFLGIEHVRLYNRFSF